MLVLMRWEKHNNVQKLFHKMYYAFLCILLFMTNIIKYNDYI